MSRCGGSAIRKTWDAQTETTADGRVASSIIRLAPLSRGTGALLQPNGRQPRQQRAARLRCSAGRSSNSQPASARRQRLASCPAGCFDEWRPSSFVASISLLSRSEKHGDDEIRNDSHAQHHDGPRDDVQQSAAPRCAVRIRGIGQGHSLRFHAIPWASVSYWRDAFFFVAPRV